jgi:hypothetical protein
MSALARYYTAWAINLVAFAGFLIAKALVLAPIMLATFVYISLIRCPTCGSRVGKNRRRWAHPFPAKICLNCGHDLTRPQPAGFVEYKIARSAGCLSGRDCFVVRSAPRNDTALIWGASRIGDTLPWSRRDYRDTTRALRLGIGFWTEVSPLPPRTCPDHRRARRTE